MAWTTSANPRRGLVSVVGEVVRDAWPDFGARSALEELSKRPRMLAVPLHLALLLIVLIGLRDNLYLCLAAVIAGIAVSSLVFMWPARLHVSLTSLRSDLREYPWHFGKRDARPPASAGISELGRSEITVAQDNSMPVVSAAGLGLAPKGAPAYGTEALTSLMARVSHEIRTPLNAVVGFSDLMDCELFGPLGHPRYEEYVRHIRDSGKALLKSAEDTLAVTSLLTDPRAAKSVNKIKIAAVAADAWECVQQDAAERNISLDLRIKSPVIVLGERRAFRQILINLLTEAVARAEDESHIVLSAVPAGERVIMEITVAAARPGCRSGEGSLALCLARALLELNGSALVECQEAAGGWHAVALLERATQSDLFDPQSERHEAMTFMHA